MNKSIFLELYTNSVFSPIIHIKNKKMDIRKEIDIINKKIAILVIKK